MKTKSSRSYRTVIQAELDTLPLMGLFVVLIPMLLLSAVFLEISVIDMYLPSDESSQEEKQDDFTISVVIRDDQYVVKARGFDQRVVSRAGDDAVEYLYAELYAITTQRPKHRAVTIVSSPETRYEDIITVMDVSREAGLPHASLTGDGS